MRRTVKLSFMPRPWCAITMPAKICTRSFSPSLTRVWTLTESPTRNGTCFLICSPSIFSISFIVFFGSLKLFPEMIALRDRVVVDFLQQVGPKLLGAAQRLFLAPFLDLAVMTGEQNFRHAPAAKFLGPRVLRALE